ncbi:MAG: hypothetical protein HUK20_11340 [Fibrobacter sp.]|nr:hypothetical protein [Fibrobacter sp.]
MKKMLWAFAFGFMMFLTACFDQAPSVVAGRDWNPGAQVVADTTSQFHLDEPMVIQFNYGKNFDFSSLKTVFYQGTTADKGKEIWSREVPVTHKLNSYTLQGKSKKGGLMSARELTRFKTAGSVVVEFVADGKVIVSKDITLTLPGK